MSELDLEELLSAYLDDELAPAEREFVERALEASPRLQACLEGWQAAGQLLRDLPVRELDPGFVGRVRQRIAQLEPVRTAAPPRRGRVRWPAWVGLGMAAAVIGIVVWWGDLRSPPRQLARALMPTRHAAEPLPAAKLPVANESAPVHEPDPLPAGAAAPAPASAFELNSTKGIRGEASALADSLRASAPQTERRFLERGAQTVAHPPALATSMPREAEPERRGAKTELLDRSASSNLKEPSRVEKKEAEPPHFARANSVPKPYFFKVDESLAREPRELLQRVAEIFRKNDLRVVGPELEDFAGKRAESKSASPKQGPVVLIVAYDGTQEAIDRLTESFRASAPREITPELNPPPRIASLQWDSSQSGAARSSQAQDVVHLALAAPGGKGERPSGEHARAAAGLPAASRMSSEPVGEGVASGEFGRALDETASARERKDLAKSERFGAAAAGSGSGGSSTRTPNPAALAQTVQENGRTADSSRIRRDETPAKPQPLMRQGLGQDELPRGRPSAPGKVSKFRLDLEASKAREMQQEEGLSGRFAEKPSLALSLDKTLPARQSGGAKPKSAGQDAEPPDGSRSNALQERERAKRKVKRSPPANVETRAAEDAKQAAPARMPLTPAPFARPPSQPAGRPEADRRTAYYIFYFTPRDPADGRVHPAPPAASGGTP